MAVGVRQAEINDLKVLIVIQQKILRLQIAMDYIQLVNVLNTS